MLIYDFYFRLRLKYYYYKFKIRGVLEEVRCDLDCGVFSMRKQT